MNIQEILDQYGIAYKTGGEHRHVRQGWIGVNCPWCGHGSIDGFHLGINLINNYAVCWRCGYHRMGDVLAELLRISLPEALNLLGTAERAGGSPEKAVRPPGRVKLPQGLQRLRRSHRAYLVERGFDPAEIVRLWGVQGISINARLSWRLFIPIHQRGEIVSWTTRSIGGYNTERYISASPDEESVPHRDILYGADYARHSVVVCEGPTDVWRIGPGAVATLGLGYSRWQLLAIAEYPVRAICFDREPAATKRAKKLAGELTAFPGLTTVIELQTGDDAADADAGEVAEIRAEFLEKQVAIGADRRIGYNAGRAEC